MSDVTATIDADAVTSPESDQIVAEATSRGVPIVSGRQVLDWLDGRNGSSFQSIAWNGTVVSFSVAVGAGANGLQAMLPTKAAAGNLTTLTVNGNPVAFIRQRIKGRGVRSLPGGPGNVSGDLRALGARSKAVATSSAGKHVLIVDDDRAVLGLVEQWLTGAGYSVVACDRFETAKQHLAHATPDILLTDVRLGAFNGLQLVILAKERWPHTLALVMSAFDDPLLHKEAVQCGAGYLSKPFTRAQVLVALSDAPTDETAVI